MPTLDLGPAAETMAALVRHVPEEALSRPTPCVGTSVGALLDHIGGLSLAFTWAAAKDQAPGGQGGPSANAHNLRPDWRAWIPARLADLVEAWRVPEAWTGTTSAGGVDLPGEVAGLVALDELVLHGWDLAVATGQEFRCDPLCLAAVHDFVQQTASPDTADQRDGLFGPVVAVPDDAPLLARVLGLSGRDPNWVPPA